MRSISKETHTFLSEGSLFNVKRGAQIDASDKSSHWRAGIDDSWHMWTRTDLYDGSVLPLWPPYLDKAGIVISTASAHGISQSNDSRAIPEQAAMLVPTELEPDGIHVFAIGGSNTHLSNMLRFAWGDFLAAFAGEDIVKSWDNHDGHPSAAFIPIKEQNLYYYSPLNDVTKRALMDRKSSGVASKPFDLARHAFPDNHFLIPHLNPEVFRNKKNALDQVRIEIILTRTHNGFIQIQTQVVSKVVWIKSNDSSNAGQSPMSKIPITIPVKDEHEHPNIELQVLHNRESSDDGWIWNGQKISNSPKFSKSKISLKHVLSSPKLRSQKRTLDKFILKAKDARSLHPKLSMVLEQNDKESRQHCDLELIFPIPQTHFFDPYQLRDLEKKQLGDLSHHGPIQLEFPTEELNSWGSVLWLHKVPTQQNQMNSKKLSPVELEIPFHTRYRLTDSLDQARYPRNGYKIKSTERTLFRDYVIEGQFALPTAFWNCKGTTAMSDHYTSDGFIHPRVAPVLLRLTHPELYYPKKHALMNSIIPIQVDSSSSSDGTTQDAVQGALGLLLLETPVPDPSIAELLRWATSTIVVGGSAIVVGISVFKL
ncbi:protease B nonderepressible form [Mycoemilia scoparia]|uniref:Protein PBN1 n=1 Tax=Mycoemilia scoparia TaxID=417184 RepID=A0A9W7ZTE2_9FUNG|nr:protease B nonderepressible form [Mycoemilia scoparia]